MMVLASTGCGRWQFDWTVDAASNVSGDDVLIAGDATDDAASGPCDATAPFTSIAEVPMLNGGPSTGQGGLRLTPDELVAVFHSNRGGSGYELYVTSRASRSDNWSVPAVQPLGNALFFGTLTPDGLTLLYRESGDFYIATRGTRSDTFTSSTPYLGVQSGDGEQVPYLDAAGTTLYFTRTIGAGPEEVWVTDFPAGNVEIQLNPFNTMGTESGPVISADGLTLYYSYQAMSSPEIELFVTQRASTATAFAPGAKVAELDSSAFDGPSWISPDNCRLYFESRRNSSDFRMFVAERAP